MKPRNILSLLLGSSLVLPAYAADSFDAASFLHEKCSSCHDQSLYARPDRRVRNRAQLERQVRFCDANVGARLFDEDIEALVDYLDRHYYHFSE